MRKLSKLLFDFFIGKKEKPYDFFEHANSKFSNRVLGNKLTFATNTFREEAGHVG